MADVDIGYGVEDCLGMPWDSLAEHDWVGLGSSDTTSVWEGDSAADPAPGPEDSMAALKGDGFTLQKHGHDMFGGYSSGDAPAGSYDPWAAHHSGAMGLGKGGHSNPDGKMTMMMGETSRGHTAPRSAQAGETHSMGHHEGSYVSSYGANRAPNGRAMGVPAASHGMQSYFDAGYPAHGEAPNQGRQAGGSVSSNGVAQPGSSGSIDLASAAEHPAPSGKSAIFLLHLFATVLTDAPLVPQTPVKAANILEQLRRKTAKEQTMTVHMREEGPLEMRLRIFVSNSTEAQTVSDYVAANPQQVPAPFVILSQLLPIAVSYDPALVDPSQASVCERLRKQAKTMAFKLFQELAADQRAAATSSILRGYRGPLAAANPLAKLVTERSVAIDADPNKRYIIYPAKIRGSNIGAGSGTSSHAGSPWGNSAAAGGAGGGGRHPRKASRSLSLDIPNGVPTHTGLPLASPDSMSTAPSTPRSGGDAEDDVWGDRPSAFFPVSLFVTAIADGELANDVSHKSRDRLVQIIRKVPKEQNTSVEVAEGHTIDLKMRVFVVNSEDAKAVGEYMSSHLSQNPAPFVLLAKHIPMAVLYDPTTLDLGDASVADRLRKQAKTRTVKVLRESIANKSLGVTTQMLRGHLGPLEPAQRLEAALQALCQPVMGECSTGDAGGSSSGNYIVFAARNKAAGSAPSSPRQRTTPTGANNKRGASASQLHRKILDKALKKAKKSPSTPAAAPDTPPLGLPNPASFARMG